MDIIENERESITDIIVEKAMRQRQEKLAFYECIIVGCIREGN